MHEESWNYIQKNDWSKRVDYFTKYIHFLMSFDETTGYRYHNEMERKRRTICENHLCSRDICKMTRQEFDAWYQECRKAHGGREDTHFTEVYEYTVEGTIGYYDAVREEIRITEKKKVIYGAGDFGKRLKHEMDQRGIRTDYFCQSEVKGEKNQIEGVDLISLEQLKVCREPLQVLIAMADRKTSRQIRESLREQLGEDCDIYELGGYIRWHLS